MNLDLGHIEERETFSFQERFTVPTQENVASECDTTVTGTIVRTGSRLLLDAHITSEVHVACDRCLSEYNLPIDTDFNLVFSSRDAGPGARSYRRGRFHSPHRSK